MLKLCFAEGRSEGVSLGKERGEAMGEEVLRLSSSLDKVGKLFLL